MQSAAPPLATSGLRSTHADSTQLVRSPGVFLASLGHETGPAQQPRRAFGDQTGIIFMLGALIPATLSASKRATPKREGQVAKAAAAKITEQVHTVQDEHLVKYTAEDAKKRAPAWARGAGPSLDAVRARWRKQDAPPGLEYARRGVPDKLDTTNLSALLLLELAEHEDVDAAVGRALPVLSDVLYVVLVHCIHETRQSFVRGRPSSGRAFRVEADLDSAAKYQVVLDSWLSQRSAPPSEAVERATLFIRDVADGVARPTTRKYGRDGNSVREAIASQALSQADLPVLQQLVTDVLVDIEAPPCTKFQSLRVALRHVERCLVECLSMA